MGPASTRKRSHVLWERGLDLSTGSKNDSVSVMDQTGIALTSNRPGLMGRMRLALWRFKEIAMGEGKEKEARQYFQAAEKEIGTLEPEHAGYSPVVRKS
jgi:hypothetical protein